MQIDLLMKKPVEWLQAISNLNRSLCIWGGAAKRTVLADTMRQVGRDPMVAIDTDRNKWGSHLKGSGSVVVSPRTLPETNIRNTREFVAHLNQHLNLRSDKIDFSDL